MTGGEGKLAKALCALDPSIDAPSRRELDVTSWDSIRGYCKDKSIDVIVHAAAVTNKFREDADERYILTNIIGTANVVLWCKQNNIRLVYISSDYVYPSERGNYTEASPLLPANRYAKSKLGGEMSVQLYDNSLIVRTSFYAEMDFPKACTDQFTSRVQLEEAAKAVYGLAVRSDLRGVINLGSPAKRSLYEIVKKEFRPTVEACRRQDIQISYPIPPDSSLDTAKYFRVMRQEAPPTATRKVCRVCGSADMTPFLDLGRVPLANAYLREEEISQPEFKEALVLQLCRGCGLTQLTKVVPPERMFRHYLYRSSTPKTFHDHCRNLAKTAAAKASCKEGDLVLDIASNDGCLLSKFREIGLRVVGVDPAENIVPDAEKAGIPTLCAYWSRGVAQDILSRFGPPKIITSQNVLGHTDDVHEFASAVDRCLAPRGLWIIEVPYVLDFIRHNEFDTAYHEHLSYFSISALAALGEKHGFQVVDVQYFSKIHGGTVRVFVARSGDYKPTARVASFLAKERAFGLRSLAPYKAFAKRVLANKKDLVKCLEDLRRKGKKVWAYGAGAKGNILLNFSGITSDLSPVVIDDNPQKWGYYLPGSHMRIAKIEELVGSDVDYLLVLAWNFGEEIIRRCKAAGYCGGYILPVPTVQVVEKEKSMVRSR